MVEYNLIQCNTKLQKHQSLTDLKKKQGHDTPSFYIKAITLFIFKTKEKITY